MLHDPRKYLCDMQDRALFVAEVLKDRVREDLDDDRIIRCAVERELISLGEALNQLHRLAPEIAEQIERWKDIIGFRHILVHGYDIMDMDVVWDIVRDDIPLLLEQLDAMLKKDY
jgi:uncharacterized protein with HEPN domain